MAHLSERHSPVLRTQQILLCARLLGLLLTFSCFSLNLTGCSGVHGSGTINSSAPSITTEPANQAVAAGQTATFTVAATGTAPLSYQWKKNGTAIAGATSSSYTTPPTTSSDDGAQFTVVVSNTAGSVTSNAATLTLSSAQPPFGHVLVVVEENTDYSSVIWDHGDALSDHADRKIWVGNPVLCKHPSLDWQLFHADHGANSHQQ